MENISKHISYTEATKSLTAIRYNIKNTPNEQQLANMLLLAEKVYEPLRSGLGDIPIRIASFFRCKDLNDMVGGAINSQHMAIKGAAMDIDNDGHEPSNRTIFFYIKDNIEFDQLIWESGDNENPDWVHVSFNKDKNRNQVLRFKNNKYIPYEN
jgi:hypothetical protein